MRQSTNILRKLLKLWEISKTERTVATRHQRYICYKMTCATNFIGGENAYGPGMSLPTVKMLYSAIPNTMYLNFSLQCHS